MRVTYPLCLLGAGGVLGYAQVISPVRGFLGGCLSGWVTILLWKMIPRRPELCKGGLLVTSFCIGIWFGGVLPHLLRGRQYEDEVDIIHYESVASMFAAWDVVEMDNPNSGLHLDNPLAGPVCLFHFEIDDPDMWGRSLVTCTVADRPRHLTSYSVKLSAKLVKQQVACYKQLLRAELWREISLETPSIGE